MRDSEKRFLKLIGKEFVILEDIQAKLGLSYADAEHFANYLAKEGLIRSTKLATNVSARGYIYMVCKPIDKRKWREKYWVLLSLITYLGGILSAYTVHFLSK